MSCPSSIQCRNSNLKPLEHESPPITTRPGLPPNGDGLCIVVSTRWLHDPTVTTSIPSSRFAKTLLVKAHSDYMQLSAAAGYGRLLHFMQRYKISFRCKNATDHHMSKRKTQTIASCVNEPLAVILLETRTSL